MKGVYEFREDKGWDYTKSSDISDESQYALMIEGLPK